MITVGSSSRSPAYLRLARFAVPIATSLSILLLIASAWLAGKNLRSLEVIGLATLATLLLGGVALIQHRARQAILQSYASLDRFTRAFGMAQGMMREMGGRITFWHGGAERLYGYPAKDALGRISHDLLRTEFSRPLAEIEAELRADGFWQGELTQKRRDGAEVIVASQWVLHRDRMLGADVVIEVNTDITALKRAEEEVRDKEILLEAVLDALPVGVIIADAEGRIVRDNTASRELWGVPPETTSWAEYSNWVGWWPGSGKEIKAEEWAMTRALLRGEITRGELVECQQFGSGERSVFLNNAAPVRDTAGRILGAVAAVMDVTEARRAELVNQELLATLDLAAAFIRDEGGIIRFWSAGCERLYGWTAKEAIGRAAHELLRTSFPVPFAEIEAALAQTGEWTGDLWQRTRDGRALVVRVRKLLRRRASELARVLEVLSDVTAQRATEARLRASEARFRAAVEAVNGILWTTNAAGEMEGEQTGWAALTGQSQKEYEGRGWLEAVHPDDAQTTLDAWHKAVEERKPFVFEHRLCRRNGGWRRYAIHAIPLLRDDNTVYEWVGVHTDVTEQREAEAVLTRDRDELERLVSERTRDLEQTRERLVHAQRMEALGRLAGGIAHDFNNVLQAVEGGASLIERRPADLDNVRRRVRMIMDAAGRGAAITRRLLAFARRDDLRAEPVDVAPLLDGVCEILAHTLDPAIEIRTETPPGLPPLIADRGQLETVLINLAMNSRDAMPNGGVITLAARTEVLHNRKSRMAQSIPANLQPGRYLRLLVADTGAGMAPEVLSRASEPFFTTKGQGEGTGLGLAMAKGFAEQSGGALHIESTPGHGAIITLWFPAAAPTIVSSLTSTARKTHAAVRRHVLLVDDDALVREITADQLKMEGYSVRSAESGPEALALLDTGEAVDLLISDLAMPGMNGIAVISEAQKRRSRLPAILLTGFAGDTTELAISEKLRNTVLVRKPVIGPQLVEQAEMLLTS